ncbi:MAG TPA: TonB-dependent receptor [Acidobacteriota bacterium]|nr:TonB-dependent receptor [Acidobacteriota bacterium]
MRNKILLALVVALAFTVPVFAQVALKTGSIYGKTVDDKGAPLPGVSITLESDVIPTQTATSGASGGFRFANLPPGTYSVNFSIEGFTEVRQEEVRVSTGSQVQLEITLKPSLAEEFTVIGETPVVDTKKTGVSDTFNRDYLEDVPSARDPWTIIDQTSGIDSDRYNVAGSESGQQASFIARGGSDDNTTWNYDGVNATDPGAVGASPTYFDFDAFEELQISTGGNDASVGTGGVVVNIVTKRGGNKWEGNASYFYSGDSLQGDNTPDELAAIGAKSNRLDLVRDYGFDLGGPIVKDKFFVWGAYRKNEIGLITVADLLDKTELEDWNFKANMNWSSAHESQFGYFKGEKTKSGRAAISPAFQAAETLWEQGGTDTITPGIWTGQHTWIPNDHTIVTGRYGYIGLGFTLVARGGTDKQMILLASIPRWEQTIWTYAPIDRPAHDFVVDANYFAENVAGGDHEFKFGFEYKRSKLHTSSFYGNGIYLIDYYQETPGGNLTSGYFALVHQNDGRVTMPRTSFYANDTYRRDRLTLNFGVRFDSQTGTNDASTATTTPGYEDVLSPVVFGGNDPGVTFNDFSPRVGVTYDLTGDGKTVIRGNFARYYDGWAPGYLTHSNPTYVYNGAYANYTNLNGDREITRDEITTPFGYFGGAVQNFTLDAFLANRLYADDIHNSGSNEFLAGFERQLSADLSASVTYTRRTYFDPLQITPTDVGPEFYTQTGTQTFNSVLGTFTVPLFAYTGPNAGQLILRNIEDYNTTYNGVDINVRKRMSNNFMLSGSLVLQRQSASYDGNDAANYIFNDGGITGQAFPGNPANVAQLDGEPYAFAPLGSGKSGVYPYSEWQVKFSGVYQFPWDISVGAFGRYQQGYPFVLWARTADAGLAGALGTTRSLVLVEPVGERRFENLFTLDLQFEKGFEFGNYGRLALSANLFNVFNTNTVIRRNRQVETTTLNRIDELISPRALRLGIRYSF